MEDSLEGRLLNLSKSLRIRKKKKAGRPLGKLYDWIEVVMGANLDGDDASAEHHVINAQMAVKEAMLLVRKNLTNIKNLSVPEVKEDILRILVLHINNFSTGEFPSYAKEYLMTIIGLPTCQSLKPLVYMSLSTVGYDAENLEDKFYDVVIEDIDACDVDALRWIANITNTIPSPFAERIISSLQNLLFRSVASVNVLEKSASALLNITRNRGDVMNECYDMKRLDTLLQREGSTASLLKLLLQLACNLSEVNFAAAAPVAGTVAACLEKAFIGWSVATCRVEKYNAVSIATKCLQYFSCFHFRLEQDEKSRYTIPGWWLSLNATLSAVIKKDISFECDQIQRESTVLDKHRTWHRSASLLASLQVGAIHSLSFIYKNQLNSPESNQACLNHECVENGIVFGSLVNSLSNCLLKLLQYEDEHVKYAAVKALYDFSSSVIPQRNGEPSLRLVSHKRVFCNVLSTSVDSIISEVFDIFLEEKDDAPWCHDLQTCRTILEVLVTFSSTNIASRIQVYLMNKLREDEDAVTGAIPKKERAGGGYIHRRREEFVRALILFNERNFIQSLQMIATAARESYNNVVSSCGGNALLLYQSTSPNHMSCVKSELEEKKFCPEDVPKVWSVWQRHITPSSDDTAQINIFPSLFQLSNDQTSSSQITSLSSSEDEVTTTNSSNVLRTNGGLTSYSQSSLKRQESMFTPASELSRTAISAHVSSPSMGDVPSPPSRKTKFSLANISQKLSFSSTTESQDLLLKVSKESISVIIREVISGLCFKDGSLQNQAIDLQGKIFMLCKVNSAVTVEIGMNLNHPNVFSGVLQRLGNEETISAYAVTIEKDAVRKVDPRGSIIVMAKPSKDIHLEKEVLQYNMKCRSCPLKVMSTSSMLERDTGGGKCDLIIRQEYSNTSDVFDLCKIDVDIDIPSNYDVKGYELFGDNQMKFKLSGDSKSIVCTHAKLKCRKTAIIHLKLNLSAVNINRFGTLDEHLQSGVTSKKLDVSETPLDNARISFVIVQPKHKFCQNVSALSGFNLRYINVFDKTVSISKNISFESSVQAFEASFGRNDASSTTENKTTTNSLPTEERSYSPPENLSERETEKNLSNVGSKLVSRPWGWEEDARQLENLYDETVGSVAQILTTECNSSLRYENEQGYNISATTDDLFFNDESKSFYDIDISSDDDSEDF